MLLPSDEGSKMIPADLALAQLMNRTAQAYDARVPAYVSYRETTHVAAPSMDRSQEIDRVVVARNADGQAVMRDVPGGGQHVGDAFPIIPVFDPFSSFTFSWFANLKAVNISLERKAPWTVPMPPQAGTSADVVVPYFSIWDVRYAPDSRPDRLHFFITPTPRSNGGTIYPSELLEDPSTHLPSKIVLRYTDRDDVITLDYGVVDGYWVIEHGTFGATEHAVFMTFYIVADVTFSDFSFPASPPEATLLPPPSPSSSP